MKCCKARIGALRRASLILRRGRGCASSVKTAVCIACLFLGCKTRASYVSSLDASSGVAIRSNSTGGGGSALIDCVGVLHVRTERGYEAANVQRFGESSPTLRTSARVADLGASDLRAFCDWEACIRADGYRHTCWGADAGWERCRVCNGAADCDGHALSQDDCVAHATDQGRGSCHVGLLQECYIQQAVRGLADARVTQSCLLSQQACAGELPGDLSGQALAAQHETDQVIIEECQKQLDLAAQLDPDSSTVAWWQQQLSSWEGGSPPGEDASLSDSAPSDAGALDAGSGG